MQYIVSGVVRDELKKDEEEMFDRDGFFEFDVVEQDERGKKRDYSEFALIIIKGVLEEGD